MAEKIELVKQLLDTNDINIIESIKSILSSSTKYSNDYANLPDEVIKDISEVRTSNKSFKSSGDL